MSEKEYIKGRGAQQNSHNKFLKHIYETRDDFLEFCRLEGEEADNNRTQYIPIFPKTIVNKVTSPDISMAFSMNPYQGCEHGCIYCYARNSHEYWGYSAGLDFERKILIKKDAPKLLEQKLKSKNWVANTIILSGNTDCYQPAEKEFKITRACLEVFYKYRHPVGIITKNALILRDLDILKKLAKHNLVGVNVSVTSLSEETRRILEPRTVSIKKRLETIKILSENNIPVNAMLAPIIPGINSHEILQLAKAVADNGALSFTFTVVRLNGAIGQIFTDWIHKTLPGKAEKVLHQIEACHGGNLNDSRFGIRSKGNGVVAEQIHSLVKIAKHKYFKNKTFPKLNNTLYEQHKNGQFTLF
ncbi:PA0069 family radical SAM protein [Cellulophaga lytica]|uniref:Radical SAM domain protein n=1 Tax=Cellulophaga lytica (strain ATCC 23178 / DSM 7489 / JCM 8516 / NBRC 14961 / NCIMB 1423 / VKM B-1433 / Cy l20) TaxID=867900 RepID=F0RA86_CELLC|nr:PA0069 family radical SAM protein [Cellulophaga lytica]ADY29430.1 Radical SAM domain protein [Cellulophaga lytica DSM 7489]AIM60442.1 radical SAM protein [Cellulophaga lytica]WQG76397.1 PA0069 family radical SAM protein [Cellulophaga lytica]